MSKILNFSRKQFCLTILSIICWFNLAISEEIAEEKTCLMDSICKNKDKDGANKNAPCHKVHVPYSNITDDDFYDLLWNHCPHFFDEKGELIHKICCSAEQEDSISRLVNQVEIIRRPCPSCTVNAKKYFCNLFCLPNQNEFLNIEKKVRNSIVNVSYVVSKKFAQVFYDSCYDVKIFGAYLMDQEFICGPHKRDGCDVNKFLTKLGSISQMPLIIRPVIAETSLLSIMGQNYVPMNDDVYQCDEAPPNDNKCACDNCNKRCNETLLKNLVHNRLNQKYELNSSQALLLDKSFFVRIIATILIARVIFSN